MREIKFRAWSKTHMKMYEVVSLCFSDSSVTVKGETFFEPNWILQHGEYELMQCTGFKDSGKTPIYEADKIEDDGIVYTVLWCESSGCWDCVDEDGNNINLCEFSGTITTWLQGNIYELNS